MSEGKIAAPLREVLRKHRNVECAMAEVTGIDAEARRGLYADRRIRHQIAGRDTGKPFRYHDLGSAAYISRSGAVVSVGRLRFGGFPGWLAFTGDLRRERTFPTREVGYVRDAYTSQLESSPTQISDPG